MLAFATQVAFALLMLRWFTPQEVGEFSVISQIGFFWMTLALAQAPLGLLACKRFARCGVATRGRHGGVV
jgi:hypothetical protein